MLHVVNINMDGFKNNIVLRIKFAHKTKIKNQENKKRFNENLKGKQKTTAATD